MNQSRPEIAVETSTRPSDKVPGFLSDFAYRDGLKERDTDIHIAIMGQTGAGKSTFISLLADPDQTVETSESLKSCTQDIRVYRHLYSERRNVYLVDTPGFNDSDRADCDILNGIAKWFGTAYRDGVKLSGVLFLQDITHKRAYRSSKKQMRLFKEILGAGTGGFPTTLMHNIVLVTTMWDTQASNQIVIAEGRHSEMLEMDDFWKPLGEQGARNTRFWNTLASALDVINMIVPEFEVGAPTPKLDLAIQREMVDHQLPLPDTKAGSLVFDSLEEERLFRTIELKKLNMMIQQERDAEKLSDLQQEWREDYEGRETAIRYQRLLQSVAITSDTKSKAAERYTKRVEMMRANDKQNFGHVVAVEDGDKTISSSRISLGTQDPLFSPETPGIIMELDSREIKATERIDLPEKTAVRSLFHQHLWRPTAVDAFLERHRGQFDPPKAHVELPADDIDTIHLQFPSHRPENWLPSSLMLPTSIRSSDAVVEMQIEWLFDLCRQGSLASLRDCSNRLLASNMLEIRSRSGHTVLHAIMIRKENQLEALQILSPLIPQSCFQITDFDGFLPLHYAAASGSVELVTEVIKHMPTEKICQSSKGGYTALSVAIFENHTDIARELFEKWLQGFPVVSGLALDTLITKCDTQTVRNFFNVCLTEDHVFWKSVGIFERTMLHSAMFADIEIAKICFEAIAKAPYPLKRYLVDCRDSRGMTACSQAAARGLTQHIVELFHALGSTFRIQDMVNVSTSFGSPYFLAKSRGHDITGKLLIEAGAFTDDVFPEFCGLSAREWASSIQGVVVHHKTYIPLYRKWTSRQFEKLSPESMIRQTSERQHILNIHTGSLSHNVEHLLLLAYHYFGLFDRGTYKFDPEISSYKALDPKAAIPLGLVQGPDLYALATFLDYSREQGSSLRCDSCDEPLGAGTPGSEDFRYDFYVCSSCPFAEYCTHCASRLASGYSVPMRFCKCPGPREHVWINIDLRRYNFGVEGSIFPGKTIVSYMRDLLKQEPLLRHADLS